MNIKEILRNCGMDTLREIAEIGLLNEEGKQMLSDFEKEMTKETKLETAKRVIEEFVSDACCGIFNSRNTVGDRMTTIYDSDELAVDICYGEMYFEVFGLSEEEFAELEAYYKKLTDEYWGIEEDDE